VCMKTKQPLCTLKVGYTVFTITEYLWRHAIIESCVSSNPANCVLSYMQHYFKSGASGFVHCLGFVTSWAAGCSFLQFFSSTS
jgi:hypothetical protein